MAFDRPTLLQLIARIQADIDNRVEGVDPRLRRAMSAAQARAEAGVTHGLHGHLAWLAKQLIPATADEEFLAYHADWNGVPRNDPTAAGGNIDVAGTDGSTIPVDEVLQRGDGVEYTVDAEATIAGGVASVAVTCSETGQDGNADAGVSLTFVSPVPGVQSSATVDVNGITGGTDIEDVEDWRERFREVEQEQQQGGNDADYKIWAKEVSGVTRVWVMQKWLGNGTVAVFFVRDNDDDFIPSAGEVQTVFDYIDALRPAGMKGLYVLAPVAVPVPMTIQLSPNSSAVQAAVTAGLQDLFFREGNVEDGTGSGTIKITHIREAISLADGETDHVLDLVADVTFNKGEIPTLGELTFQAL